jgi:hypothetical protein
VESMIAKFLALACTALALLSCNKNGGGSGAEGGSGRPAAPC